MEKLSVEMNVEKIRKESAIYRDLQPGSFLFEYRSKLNDAAFNIALENPTLISNKGTLLEQAKKKVEDDGYLYKKKKSRSPTLNAPQPEKSVKMNPSMRAKQLQQISEDVDEVKKEIFHLERSREKARNVNVDERALRLTKEMEPLRVRKRHLEEELLLLQRKEKKYSKDKERREKKSTTAPPGVKQGRKPSSCKKGSLDFLIKQIEGKGQSSQSNSNSPGQEKEGGEDSGRHQLEGQNSQSSSNSPGQMQEGGEDSCHHQLEGQNSQSSSISPGQMQEGGEDSARHQLEEQSSFPSSSLTNESFLVQNLDSHVTVQNFSSTLV